MSYPIRTIEKLFNRDTGNTEEASLYLDKFDDKDQYVLLRRMLRKRNKEKNDYLVCNECGTVLELSCTKNNQDDHTFYFKHLKDPDFDKCSIKTGSDISKEEIQKRQYAFKSESNPHINLKNKVGAIIKQYIYQDAIIDKKFIHDKYGDSEKRKPDIYFINKDKEIIIEFQINNTFHTVIEEREAFYERNLISLMWVFGDFDPYNFQSITVKDIFVPNGNNAFVFDSEAEQASYENRTLCLKAWYKKYKIIDDSIDFDWYNEIVTIDQIKYNPKTLRPFFFDCPADKLLADEELKKIIEEKEFEKEKQNALAKAHNIKNFLSKLKKPEYNVFCDQLEILSKMSDFEVQVLNDLIKLDQYKKNGKNIIQLLIAESKYFNLVRFLLQAKNIRLSLSSLQTDDETTLISLLKHGNVSADIIQLLFSRQYKLSQLDVSFIQENFDAIIQKRMLFLYRNFEKLGTFKIIAFFENYINEFLVIESAKCGTLTILGKEHQSLIWMANLAADKYVSHWLYFDKAFDYYKLYNALFTEDRNKTFRLKYNSLSTQIHKRDFDFEAILEVLYPAFFDTLFSKETVLFSV